MRVGWFGIPWYGYALGCLIIAISYGIFTIDPTKAYNWAAQPVWRVIILRWFHSLVWLLLCLACLLMQWRAEQGMIWAKALSLLGLVIYLTYMIFLFIEKSKSTA